MKKSTIRDQEPHFQELVDLWDAHRDKRMIRDVFRLWEEIIAPDLAQITCKQFITWNKTQRVKEKYQKKVMKEREILPPSAVDIMRARRVTSMVEIEQKVNVAADILAEKAVELAGSSNKTDRQFSLMVVTNVWGRMQKEKDIAIKAHAEKRETVGLFAKLLRGAMTGQFSMEDVQRLKGHYDAPGQITDRGVEDGTSGAPTVTA